MCTFFLIKFTQLILFNSKRAFKKIPMYLFGNNILYLLFTEALQQDLKVCLHEQVKHKFNFKTKVTFPMKKYTNNFNEVLLS